MIKRFSNAMVRIVEKYMPDPYLFAAILTMVVFVLGLIFTSAGPLALIEQWAGGLWGLLVFTMQISIALVLSTSVIRTRPVEAFLKWLCSFATTPYKAYAITAFCGGIGSLFSWAAGLIVGAFVAREMAKNVKGCHYPLLVASGYAGFMIWHMGYTSSVGLVIATPGHFLESVMGVIPTSQTIFAPFNFVTALFLLFSAPFIMAYLRPDPKKGEIIKKADPQLFIDEKREEAVTIEAANEMTVEVKNINGTNFADKLENARIINIILGIAALIAAVKYFAGGGGLTMDSTNLTFFVLALFLNKNPKQLIRNCIEGGKSLGPIVLQFPMYGGIMGMMVKSGLALVIAGWFVAISTPLTLPLWTFLSAGLVNMFIPSGGSQWAVQGPIMMEAAKEMGVSLSRVAMGVAWGDQWTNMIQPFWALPLLAIAGMRARDIMGYCVVYLLYSGIVMALAITFLFR